ncbi:16557_t:CDS:2, partial [Gigaspora rosea]
LSEWHSLVKESDNSDESDDSNELDEYDKRNEFNESDESNEKSLIINEFMAADMKIQELSIILKEHPDIVHASKLINRNDIVQEYKVWNNQHNEYDMGDQNKKRKNQSGRYGSASIISFEIPVVSDRSTKIQKEKIEPVSYSLVTTAKYSNFLMHSGFKLTYKGNLQKKAFEWSNHAESFVEQRN